MRVRLMFLAEGSERWDRTTLFDCWHRHKQAVRGVLVAQHWFFRPVRNKLPEILA